MAQTFNFIVKLANEEPAQYVLDAKKIDIGRGPDNHIQILVAEVSGKHAELTQTESGYTITDIGSSNGTKVNGLRLPTGEPVELNHGDDLLLGEEVKVEFLREGEAPVVAVAVAPPAKKKLALPKKKLAVQTAPPAAPATPVAVESPTQVDPGSPTVVLKKPGAPVVGAKTVALSKKPLAPPKKQGLVTPGAKLQPPVAAIPVETPSVAEEKPKPAIKLAPRKLAAPTPKAEPVAVVAEPEPAPPVEEKPKPAVKLAPRKLAPPAPKAAPEPEAVVAEPESAPPVEEKPKPAVKLAPRKLAAPAPKPAPEPEAVVAEPEPASPVEEKPKPAVKLAPRKLAAPAPKAAPEPEAVAAEPEPAPPVEEKPKPAVKLAPRKLASPTPSPAAEKPEPTAEAASAPELDQNSKGVTLMRKSAAPSDPDATPVLKKKDGTDEDPPSLAKKEEMADVQLKKADVVSDDSPPKLVVPKKAD